MCGPHAAQSGHLRIAAFFSLWPLSTPRRWLADIWSRAAGTRRAPAGNHQLGFLAGLLVIPAANVTSANMALFFFMGACLVGLSTANQLVLFAKLHARRRKSAWP